MHQTFCLLYCSERTQLGQIHHGCGNFGPSNENIPDMVCPSVTEIKFCCQLSLKAVISWNFIGLFLSLFGKSQHYHPNYYQDEEKYDSTKNEDKISLDYIKICFLWCLFRELLCDSDIPRDDFWNACLQLRRCTFVLNVGGSGSISISFPEAYCHFRDAPLDFKGGEGSFCKKKNLTHSKVKKKNLTHT